jgi:hypothetical protein
MAKKTERTKELVELDEPAPPSAPTVRPPFDPTKYAQTAIREQAPTLTDEAATEEARITSVLMDSTPPRGRSASAPDIRVKIEADIEALSPEEQRAILEDTLAPLDRVPHLARRLEELGPMIDDPKTAYVLGFVDGLLPLETIIDVAGLPEIETVKILSRAIEQGAVVFKNR